MVELNWHGYDICNDAYLKTIAIYSSSQDSVSIHGLGHWESWGQRLVHQIHSGNHPIFGEKTLRQTPLRQQVRVNEMISNVYSINILCFLPHIHYTLDILNLKPSSRDTFYQKSKKAFHNQTTYQHEKKQPIYTIGPPKPICARGFYAK